MFFASDNSGPVPPQVLEALTRANEGHAKGYGTDPLTEEVTQQLRDLFEAPEAAVYLVATGTVANCLALACYAQPFDTVYCTPPAHIEEDECNAPEFYTGGAKLTLVGESDRFEPSVLRRAIGGSGGSVHNAQRGPVSITQATEKGNIYSLDDLRAVTGVAREFGLPVHLDGARFANACVALGCTPAEMTWKSGVDVAVFGGTKNGLMGVEAVIFFDPEKAREFELRRKRGGHLFSKHRYLTAQMQAYLADDLWAELARTANAKSTRLLAGLQKVGKIEGDPRVNMIFARLPRKLHARAFEAGAYYYCMGDIAEGDPEEPVKARFVCDWSIEDAEIDRYLEVIGA
ncbi:beta-eliminating lyase-related protein [Roseivivax sp. GX 12232]|uniref:threonine aldolase family protein n=1 Tax=Roseivivax sp. GX 12232 TaxID=2900547 RepID=UPI001E2C9324|nr:beta-eliminating lyase-related protein [Roseivivax sp. GX 12232]MCE0506030.1 beta-eliminating lyase-related protein [Roseivivax sp. GX 12232]